MSGNPFAPGSDIKPLASPAAGTSNAGVQSGTSKLPADPFAASLPPQAKPLVKERSLQFPDSSQKIGDYSFAELNPKQYATPPSQRTTLPSDANSLNSVKASASGGFPVSFSNDAPQSQQSDRYHQFPQNPLYQGPQSSASFANTPRLPQGNAAYPAPHGQHSSAQPGFQGYSYPVGPPAQGRDSTSASNSGYPSHQSGPTTENAQSDPFAALVGIPQSQSRQNGPSGQAQPLEAGFNAPSLSQWQPTSSQAQAKEGQLQSYPQGINSSAAPPRFPSGGQSRMEQSSGPGLPTNYTPAQNLQGSFPQASQQGSQRSGGAPFQQGPGVYAAQQPGMWGGHSQHTVPTEAQNQVAYGGLNDPFRPQDRQSHTWGGSAQNSNRSSGQGDAELRGNALTRPFYPAGDLRSMQPAPADPVAEAKLWDFAQLDLVRAARKSIDEEAKKEKQVPMRRSTQGTQPSNWATFDQPAVSAPSQPPQPVSHSMRPAEDFLTFPQSTGHGSAPIQHQHQPGSRAGPPQAPHNQAPTHPERSSTHVAAQPASLHANPQNPAPSPQPAANRVPWALSPPKNDPLRPRTQGEGAFSSSTTPGLQPSGRSDLSAQMNNLHVNNNMPEAWRNLSESDAALARKLQADYDKESNQTGNPGGAAPLASPFSNLNKRSAVAIKEPSPAELDALQRNLGKSDIDNRANAFLARVGARGDADEELARKLQAEYDAEAKQGSKGRPQRYNQGAYAMATQSQTPTHQSTYVQPQQSLHDDEALAHRLQQEEIRRSQSYSSQLPQQPQNVQPRYGHGPNAYPQAHHPGQGYPQGYPQSGQPPQGYPGHPGSGYQGYPGPGYGGQQGPGYQGQSGYPQANQWPGQAPSQPQNFNQQPNSAGNRHSQSYPAPPAWHVRNSSTDQHSPVAQNTNQAVDDAALARQLQEQYDRESQDMMPRQSAQPRPQEQPKPAEPHKSSGLAFWKRMDRLMAPSPESLCAGCKQPVVSVFGGSWLTALGGKWHKDCFCCGLCKKPIQDASFAVKENGSEQVPYHHDCHRQAFHPRCCVCSDFLPQKDGRITWTTDAFWKYKACESHNTDRTPRCYSCNRLQTRGEHWVPVNSAAEADRCLCLDCVGSVVVDTKDAQPLYDEVLRFYAQQGMALPTKPPLLLVEPSALESAEMREKRHHALHSNPKAPVFHTRGLTLSMEYQSMKTVARRGQSWLPEYVSIPGSRHSEVTAILVLAGLPRLMTGSILAHECMHAWLRLTSSPHLSRKVEEGLCQLIAYLWLQTQTAQPQGSFDEKLQSFCEHQIRTEQSPDYGDGFREALDALSRSNMPLNRLIDYCKTHNRFP